MAQAKRDGNYVPTLLAVSNADGTTPVTLYADPVTHRLLVSSSGGGGDVVGPASATNNAVVVFDGTTGKLVKNSTLVYSSNVLSGLTEVSAVSEFGVRVDGNKYFTFTDGVFTAATGSIIQAETIASLDSSAVLAFSAGEVTTTTNVFRVYRFDDGAEGAVFEAYHESASPASLDAVLNIDAYGKDSGGTKTQYAKIEGLIVDPTDTAEVGALRFSVISGGSLVNSVGVLGNGLAFFNGSTNYIQDISFNPMIAATTVGASAVNYVEISNSLTGVNPTISPVGSDSVIGLRTVLKGSGSEFEVVSADAGATGPYMSMFHNTASPAANDTLGINFYSNDSGAAKSKIGSFYTKFTDTTAGAEVSQLWFALAAGGGGFTDIASMRVEGFQWGNPAGFTTLDANGNEMTNTVGVASAVNYLEFSSSSTGNAVSITGNGDDTNVSVNIVTKGSGVVQANGTQVVDLGDNADASTTTTGTSTTTFVTPDGLAGSNYGKRIMAIQVFESDAAVSTGNGTVGIPVTSEMNGWNIVGAQANVYTKGVTGTTDIQIRKQRGSSDIDVLSTLITVGDEYFAADGVINTSNDDLATGDMLFVDVDGVHSGTAPNGLSVAIIAQLP